jgi:hypothetical protein
MNLKKTLKDWKTVIIFTPIIIAIAVFLRAYNLNSIPVFADEAIYIRWAQVMKSEPTLRFLPLSDGKQPLFMWSIIPFLKIFEDPLVAGRVTSLTTGIGSTIGVLILTHILFKNKIVSLIAATIYAISPFTVFFDRMAMADSMLSFFGIWTLVFALITSRYERLDTAMLAGFALGGAALTKSPALFFALLIPTTILFFNWSREKHRPLHLIKLVGLWVVIWGVGYGFYNILRLGPNFHLIATRNNDYVFPISHIWENPKDPLYPHFDRAIEWIRMMGPSTIIFLAVLSLVENSRRYWKELLILLIWSLVPIAIQSEFAKVFTARYILFSIPYILILAASSAVPFMKLGKRSYVKRYLLPILIIVFLIQSLWFNYLILKDPQKAPLPRSERSGYLEEWTSGTGIKEVSKFIIGEHEQNPDQQIVIGTEGYFGTLPDGLQIYLQNVPNVTVIGIGLGINSIPDSLIESVNFGNKTYLLANSSRLNFEGFNECSRGSEIKDIDCEQKIIEDNGFKVAQKYKKADRPSEFREFIHYGKYDFLYLLEVLPITQ